MAGAPQPSRRRLLIAGAGAAALAGCAAPGYLPAPVEEAPPPTVRVGDRWRYALIDRYRGERFDEETVEVVATAPWLRLRVSGPDGVERDEEVYADPWRVIREPGYDQPIQFVHPSPVLPWRLAAGGYARVSNAIRTPGGDRTLHWSEWIDALGWERVRVPAGDFVALRVLRRIAFEHPDPFRERSSRQETLWYAPEVNRWVQREWTGTYFWPGMRLDAPLREQWVLRQLLEYRRG